MNRSMNILLGALLIIVSTIHLYTDQGGSVHTTEISLDFEVDDGSLSHGGEGDLWEWGQPGQGSNDDPGPGTSGSGDLAWGCPLNGTYSAGSEAYLQLPLIDTTSYKEMTISFLIWYDLLPYDDEKNMTGTPHYGDELILQGSLDGIGWFDIEVYEGSTTGWQKEVMDLTEQIEDQMSIRFLLRENGDGHVDNGVLIDLFEVSASSKDPVEITLSPRSYIPSFVVKNERCRVLVEAFNNGQDVPEGTELSLHIEDASGQVEFSDIEIVGASSVTSEIIEWYPSKAGNFRGWINLTIGGEYHEGRSFSISSSEAVFYDDGSVGIDHWNIGGQPPDVDWQVLAPDDRAMSMSSSSVFWCGGSDSGPNGTAGFSGAVEKYLESDWIDLSYYTSSYLLVYQKYDLDGDLGSSGGIVQALDKDGIWFSLVPTVGTYGSLDDGISSTFGGMDAFRGTRGWGEEKFDMSQLLGGRTRIRFVLVSGEEGYGDGWFLDDITVSGQGYDPLDTDPPASIEGLDLDIVDEGAVSISWYPSIAQDFKEYRIYVEDSRFDDVEGLTPREILGSTDLTSVIITGLEPMRTYWCAVAVMDLAGNMVAEVNPLDFQPTELDLNTAPVAVIDVEGGYRTRNVGEDITLDGSGSYDPDGDQISFIWTLPDGEVRRGSRVTWRASDPGEDTEFRLEVIDSFGKSSKDNVSLSVVELDDDIQSNQKIVPFLIFIAPFALIVILLVVFLISLGRRGRKDLEKRLKKIGLEMDQDGKLISIPLEEGIQEKPPSGSSGKVLDMVPRKMSTEVQKEQVPEPLPKWEGQKKSPEGSHGRSPIKVVLECPHCSNSFKRSIDPKFLRSGSSFDVECPHCGEKGTMQT